METLFFYGSMVVIWIGFGVILYYKSLNLASIIIGITSIAYSMIFEITLGDYKEYYYYISKENSMLYITLAAVLIYPFLNVVYTMFLPEKKGPIIIYTSIWIAAMLTFELASFWSKTIVTTGWTIIPWSIITYIVTYAWVFVLYKHLLNKGLGKIRYFEKSNR